MTTAIETYLNSLSYYTLTIDISSKYIKSLPDLTRFKNLKELNCSDNELTFLPTLPKNLTSLNCSDNELTSLPTLPQNLLVLYCRSNKLTSLPTLPQKLISLSCRNNKLTYLPNLPQNLITLYCYDNKLTSLPNLPQNLQLYCNNNPIYEIVHVNSFLNIKQNIQIINNFRHLYYCLKFKKQLRKWLWEKVREPIVKKLYNPNYLIEKLGEDDDLDTVLDNWK
jgi:Leucine-rich repeat (LRR) protein